MIISVCSPVQTASVSVGKQVKLDKSMFKPVGCEPSTVSLKAKVAGECFIYFMANQTSTAFSFHEENCTLYNFPASGYYEDIKSKSERQWTFHWVCSSLFNCLFFLSFFLFLLNIWGFLYSIVYTAHKKLRIFDFE